ncbi:hypothetical protein [Bradyrhizobium sp. dw_411]|uniref:hypothetical protein n=1 Tax=Bradyrhizobium sp. dw_411 TaxID=2720082 RepID=UPI001BCE401F|nr:hypothetical protein [Bradyrhizobium sp. dw_411]
MTNQTLKISTIDSLMGFLARVDPQGRREVSAELAKAGIGEGVQPATTDLAETQVLLPTTADEVSKRRKTALLTLAVTTLTNIIDRFEPLKAEIQNRLRKVENVKLSSAIITTVLSSSVVGSLGLGGDKAWSIALGLLAVVASVLTLIATRMEGGTKISEEFGEVCAKCETAIQLRDRLKIYANAPELFDDLEDRLKDADTLASFLTDKIARWNLPVSSA